ncbi:hypothetical protein PT285_04785 [Lactobacillus sp. ESL0791]|uniref:hypothetical protein n=1 Tax=Lactobacillus sp. ESL0791 TaxID=2983234 RepID=UPI0023F8F24F|nr:hypothetical protein [Lactobacillus sp. ESL0791]MDF7638713.1 hypothetical protein [Lactobacillus sp. ESL0791]
MTKQEIGITATANLTNIQKTEVNELMEKIHQHDGTCKDPYLSNQYSYFPEMPIFISAYESGALVGFVMIYADEKPNEEVDLYVEVLPEKRRQE